MATVTFAGLDNAQRETLKAIQRELLPGALAAERTRETFLAAFEEEVLRSYLLGNPPPQGMMGFEAEMLDRALLGY